MTPAPPVILALSDATGETSEQAAKAALAQFGLQEEGSVRTVSSIRTVQALEDALVEAKQIDALVVYTLVTGELRHRIRTLADKHDVTVVDLIGGLIRGLAAHLGRPPLKVPGLGHELTEEYFKRIAAVEFAVSNDDGKNPQNLRKAEIVLVGISRTSKTPLSNYIAHRGLKVANVPIVQDVPLPRELEGVDPRRVFALKIDAVTLMNIRKTRMQKLRMRADSDYGDLRQIRREIGYANRIFAAHPEWTQIEMSRKAVEEAAATVIEVYRSHFPPDEPGRRRKQAARKRRGAKKTRAKQARKRSATPSPKKATQRKPKKAGGKRAKKATRKKAGRKKRAGRR